MMDATTTDEPNEMELPTASPTKSIRSPTKSPAKSNCSSTPPCSPSPRKKFDVSTITQIQTGRRNLPQTPLVLATSTTRLYEQIDFLQNMVVRQQETMDAMQARIDSIINNMYEQHQQYVNLFKNQQNLQQQQQNNTSHEQQQYKEQQEIKQQLLNEKEHKLKEQQQIIKQQEQQYQQYVYQQQMQQKEWEQQQQRAYQQQSQQPQHQQAQHLLQQAKHSQQQHAQSRPPQPVQPQIAQQQPTQPQQPVQPCPPEQPLPAQLQPAQLQPAKQPEQQQCAQQHPAQPLNNTLHRQSTAAKSQPAKHPSNNRHNDLGTRKAAASSRLPPNQTERRQAKQHLHTSSNKKLKTNILSDSTCRLLNYRDISKVTDTYEEEIELTKYAGATTDKLHHMAKFYMENNMPDNLIVVAGLNDVLKQKRETRKVNCEEVTANIINIGITARENGVGRVCISEIVKPKFWDCHEYIDSINELLRQECEFEVFFIISQSNIGQGDLGDNLHVSRESGHDKLKHNILSHCYTYDNSY